VSLQTLGVPVQLYPDSEEQVSPKTALAPFHDYEGEVSKKLRKDLEKIERKIIQGKIATGSL